MSADIQKVHMLILMQPDIAKAIAFYQKLGLKLVFHIKEKWAEMQLGDIKIGLCPTATVPEWHRTGIVLQVNDIKKTYEALKDEVEFIAEPKEATHGIMVSFKDPAGNLLDLYQPTPEKVTQLVKEAVEQNPEKKPKNGSNNCAKKGSACCKNPSNMVAQG